MSKKHKKSDKKGNVFDPKSPASKALAIALSGAMVTAGTPLPVFAAENQSVSQPSEPDATSADETSSQAAAAQETAATTTQESGICCIYVFDDGCGRGACSSCHDQRDGSCCTGECSRDERVCRPRRRCCLYGHHGHSRGDCCL